MPLIVDLNRMKRNLVIAADMGSKLANTFALYSRFYR